MYWIRLAVVFALTLKASVSALVERDINCKSREPRVAFDLKIVPS